LDHTTPRVEVWAAHGCLPRRIATCHQLSGERSSPWTPKTDLIKLHVRWARKSPQNFHLDSLSTLLTVSNQVDYLPHLFLLKAKTLVVFPRSSRFSYGKFGVRFEFKTVSSKDVDSEKISRQFAGLALTLSMLQSAVIGRRGTIGKVGMRQSAARTPSLISFVNNDDSEETPRGFLGIPLMEFHKESSLRSQAFVAEHKSSMDGFAIGSATFQATHRTMGTARCLRIYLPNALRWWHHPT
jgi:hypothetical protein